MSSMAAALLRPEEAVGTETFEKLKSMWDRSLGMEEFEEERDDEFPKLDRSMLERIPDEQPSPLSDEEEPRGEGSTSSDEK